MYILSIIMLIIRLRRKFVVVYLRLPICVKKHCFQLLLFFLLVYVGSTPVCWISFAQ